MINNFDRKFYSTGLLFLLFIFFSSSNGWASPNQNVLEVIESTDTRIVFEFKPYELRFIERSINGQKFEIPQIDNYHLLTMPGKPQLPSSAVSIGIPLNSTPSIQILDYQSSLLESKNIYPAPQLVATENENERYLTEQFYLDQQSYAQNSFYPAELVQITSINTLRQQRIARVEFHPLRYNPVTKQLQKIERLRFAVLFNSPANQIHQAPKPAISEPYESIYQRLLVNYPNARNWRPSPTPAEQRFSLAKTTGDWYNPTAIFYKLFVDDPGIYRLDRAYLDSIGIDGNGLDPRTLKIYHRGRELPVLVSGEADGRLDQEDYLEFYGERNLGDSTFFNPYSDTNVYWLTWGGAPGLRMATKPSVTEADSELYEYLEQVHLEQDKIYHEGDNSQALINTEMVSGEGWVWRFFYPGDREVISIPTPNVSERGTPSRLRIKLRGTTLDPIRPNHHVNVLFNNDLIGDFYFNGTDVHLFDVTIPAVQDIENALELISVGDTGAKIDQFYLDWIELDYPRQFMAINDALPFTISSEANSPSKLTLWGFTDSDIHLFDLTNQAIISNPSITPGKRLVCKVVSAGFDDGSRVQFRINSENIISQWHRGHNLVEIDAVTGQVLATRHYDTHFSAAESDSMARYIAQLPAARIVLVAIMDEGSQNLTPAAYRALESLGSQHIRTVGFRDSWAMIGRKGAAIGSVPEVLKPRASGVATVHDTIVVAGTGQDCYLTFAENFTPSQKFMAVSKKAFNRPRLAQQDKIAELTSPQNGADLIIISHQKFLSSAQRLADYRAQHNGLRVKLVDVEDIYDEFNFGLIDPQAIKDFLKYAYQNWQAPAPSFVTLFGDASWDFKKNSGPNAKENYVPSYGNPVSDNWYVCFDGKDDFLPEMFVGRIPVSSQDEAEMVVDKIIAYENTPSASWKKNVLFITGGFNRSEQRTFTDQSKFLINNYVTPAPASCRPFQINKTTEGYFEGEKKQEILNAMDQGMMWVNFLGHAGSRTWDLMFNHPDIEELTNKDKYPFITSMTCHTGRFAEPEDNSFAEHFLFAENKGAIAFWGTTGWGYVFQDNILLKNLFLGAFIDTIHSLGKATTFAKIKLWESSGSSIYNVSTIHQYTLIGDPVIDLTLPDKPDLNIRAADITLNPAIPSEADSTVAIKIRIQNWGLATKDSVSLSVYDLKGTELIPIVNSMRCPAVGLEDSVMVIWNLKDQAGEHVLRFVVDPDNEVDEVDEENNRLDFQIYVYSSTLTVSRPIEFQVVASRRVTLQVNNPAFASSHDGQRFYQFEVDTSYSFNRPLFISSPQIAEGKIVTRWQTPELSDKTTYFWRCRTIDGPDFGNWVTASFSTQFDSPPCIWRQAHPQQFSHNDFKNSEISSRGLQLQQRRFSLEVVSAGFEDGNYVRILVNSIPAIQASRGHNLVAINPGNGQIIVARTFDTLASQDEANAMADLITGFPDGTYVLIGIMDEGSYSMTEPAYLALESLGSHYCRQVKFRDSWAIIGIKGAPIGSVAEQLTPATQGIAAVRDTLVNYQLPGAVTSPAIGPATVWNFCSWEQDISPAGTNITLDVIGFNKRLAQWETLLQNLSNFKLENLSSIDAGAYPLIRLRAILSADDGRDTPTLRNWAVSFVPVPDPAIAAEVISLSADSLVENDRLELTAQVHNVGMKVADSVKIRFSLKTPSRGRVTLGVDRLTNIPVDSFCTIQQSWFLSGFSGPSQLTVELDPEDQLNELNEMNNYFSTAITVAPDTTRPQILVSYDGKTIVMGDFVARHPLIVIQIYEDGPMVADDTTRFNLFLDHQRLAFSGNESQLLVVPGVNLQNPKLRAQLQFRPELADGDHTLEVFVRDLRNNLSYHRDDFQVLSEFDILTLFNYPNPFSRDTEFTFHLTQPADRVTIKIYTLAGKLLRTLENHHLEAGFHHLYWNGLDQDRDELANGVYLYKVTARSGNSQVERIEKLVIMR